MKKIKVNTTLVTKVAAKYGVSPEQYISDSLSVSYGHRVCAHFQTEEGEYSVFEPILVS